MRDRDSSRSFVHGVVDGCTEEKLKGSPPVVSLVRSPTVEEYPSFPCDSAKVPKLKKSRPVSVPPDGSTPVQLTPSGPPTDQCEPLDSESRCSADLWIDGHPGTRTSLLDRTLIRRFSNTDGQRGSNDRDGSSEVRDGWRSSQCDDAQEDVSFVVVSLATATDHTTPLPAPTCTSTSPADGDTHEHPPRAHAARSTLTGHATQPPPSVVRDLEFSAVAKAK